MPSPALALEAGSACPGFESGPTSDTDVDRFYANRAVEIVRAAGKGDELEGLVSPDFDFEIWRGDAASGSRMKKGADAAVAMAAYLKPTSYQFVTVFSGPIATVPPEQCRWSAKLLWRREGDELGVSTIFDFEDGRLVRVTGSSVMIVEGDFR